MSHLASALWIAMLLPACGNSDFVGKSNHSDQGSSGGANSSGDAAHNPAQSANPAPSSGTSSGGAPSAVTPSTPTSQAGDGGTPDQAPVGPSVVAPAPVPTPATNGGALVDTSAAGPYKVSSYTDNLSDPGYQSAIVYYPIDTTNTPHPATTMSGGFTNTKEDMAWLAQHLASHGFIVLDFTPTNNMVLDPNVWATGHEAGIAKLKSESQRSGSAIAGLVATDRMSVSGFSMGGAGTIVAENHLSGQLRAAVPICPFMPQTVSVKVPTLFITGTNDALAFPQNVRSSYDGMNSGAAKAFVDFAGMAHTDVYFPVPQAHTNIARYLTAWLKIHLQDQQGYSSMFSGAAASEAVSKGVFASPNDIQSKP